MGKCLKYLIDSEIKSINSNLPLHSATNIQFLSNIKINVLDIIGFDKKWWINRNFWGLC